jgi:hypothetical protein
MELRAENVKNIRSLAVCKECLRQAVEMNDQLNEELLRQKYKRCLANAWWCLREEFFAEDCHCERWVDWAIKWHKRWLELAEKFKGTCGGK